MVALDTPLDARATMAVPEEYESALGRGVAPLV